MSGSFKRSRAGLVALVALQTAFLASPGAPAVAQGIPAGTDEASVQKEFDLPSTSLYEALHAFSRQASIPLTILPGTPDGARSVAVQGRLLPAEALKRLLGGNAVPYRFVGGALIVGKPAETDKVEILGPVTVTGTVPQVGMPADNGSSGLTVMGQDMIRAVGTPDKDPMRLLRILPNVNFDNDEFKVGSSGGTGTLSEQDLTPARVSISGGKDYENKVLLDGMANRSVFDSTTTNEAAADTIGIHNPLALFPNSDILREVAVYDSNVPARYGGFTGGVIDMRTRDPASKFGGSVGYARQTDQWVHYRTEYDAPGSSVQSPEFSKSAYDMTVDVPLHQRVRTMVAASREQAEQWRVATANYANGDKGGTVSTRSSYLGAVSADVGEESTLVLKGLYAPYTQEYTRGNMADDKLETVGNNYTMGGELRHDGDALKANLAVSYSRSGYDRDAPETSYTWSRIGSKANVCAGGAQCIEGGYGDITDEQNDFQARADVEKSLLGITWSSGIDYDHTGARRIRHDNTVGYFIPVANAGVQCADPTDAACLAGEQVLTRRTTYLARDYSADTSNIGYWAQGDKSIPLDLGFLEGIDLRAGLRGDYNNYFENLNWAPRFSGTLRFPGSVALTVGANRYYSNESLVYAFYAATPAGITQNRAAPVAGVYSNTWAAATPSYTYLPSSVRTPYSDERTAALTMPLLWGDGRLKYVVRHTRDEIAMELKDGKRKAVNMGWTDYKSVSAEWVKSMENHAFLINASWSDTKRNNGNYLESPDEADTAKIYYNGSVTTRGQLPFIADNFAQPVAINAAWTSKWLEDALTVNVTGKYRFAREEIAATGATINVGGTNYSVYDEVMRNAIIRFDANASYKIDTWTDQQVELLAYIENIFNSRSQTADSTAPFERGRAYWFGLRYHF
ncbi:MAG: hypothetical protein NVV74_18585 [Magnetospirillum sp.]|nr:hypothetical protein [Magnetospirillum sp.]